MTGKVLTFCWTTSASITTNTAGQVLIPVPVKPTYNYLPGAGPWIIQGLKTIRQHLV